MIEALARPRLRCRNSMRNKTDRNDARGIAQLMRLGWYKVVHVKSLEAQRLRMLLGCRKLVVRKLVDVENEIRGTLRALRSEGRQGPVAAAFARTGHEALSEQADALIAELGARGCWRSAGRSWWSTGGLHLLVVKATLADPVCRANA